MADFQKFAREAIFANAEPCQLKYLELIELLRNSIRALDCLEV